MAGAVALRRSSRLHHPQVEERQLPRQDMGDRICQPRESIMRRVSEASHTKRSRRSSLTVSSPPEASHHKTESIRNRCRRSSRLCGGRRDSLTSVTKFTTPQRLLGQMESPQELSEWWTSDYEACPPYFAHENHPLYDLRYSPPSSEDRHWRRIIRKSTRIRGRRRRSSLTSRRSSLSSVFSDAPGAEQLNEVALMSLAELEQILDDDEEKAVTPEKGKPPTRRQQQRGATERSVDDCPGAVVSSASEVMARRSARLRRSPSPRRSRRCSARTKE